MSNTQTVIFMVGVFALIIAVDIWLACDKKSGNTISERMRALGRMWPPARIVIAFGLGLICGHFWWTPQDVYDSGGRLCPPITSPIDAGGQNNG